MFTTAKAEYTPAPPPLLRCSTSCMTHRDVGNADIAGANICPCSRKAPLLVFSIAVPDAILPTYPPLLLT